ncbi:hypothetical protein L2E82_30362 [Cichorium intybus]|uniref:Uncharacterized protein n=1 Tax=Cichorium intybus TaxID=13427 RepID=A0ACB9D0G8_CICIN|nr:hypothetical protein L2E82_30362 [Cichorium intybus]
MIPTSTSIQSANSLIDETWNQNETIPTLTQSTLRVLFDRSEKWQDESKTFLNPKSQKASVKSEQIDEPETKAQVKPISVKKEHDLKAGFQVGKQERKPYSSDFIEAPTSIQTNENLAIKKNGDAVDDPGMVASMVDIYVETMNL